MSNSFQQFMHDILLDMAIDHRVESGIVDLMNENHVMVLAEKLIDRGFTPQSIQEVVNTIAIRDGKYPDRQAYNKEGWLVTFPTPEHRNAALKKKTHFTSDPTNGQGGMNLYYKKKGQQKRQTTQGTSEVDPVDATQQAQPQQATQTEPAQQNNQPAGDGESSELPQSGQSDPQQQSQKSSEPTTPAPAPAASDDAQAQSSSTEVPPTSKQSAQGNSSAPSPEPQSTPTDGLVQLTKQYAMSKQWSSTPYGDWNDSSGKLAAVAALDGQVVPIKFVDREELKRMAEQKGITLPSVT